MKGRAEIQRALQEGWEDHFVKDNSEFVAKGIESCVLSHGDRSDEEIDPYEAPSREEMERGNAEWRRKHDEASRQDLALVAKAYAQYGKISAETNIETNIQKRRRIVKVVAAANPGKELSYITCKKLDRQEIQIPERWQGKDGFSGTTWVGAYEFAPPGCKPVFQDNIHSIFLKDRKRS